MVRMADAKMWESRVSAWRASGQSSHQFCEGREFTPGGLRHWAYRLGKTRRRGKRAEQLAPTVKMARVTRIASALVPVPAAHAPAATVPEETPLVVEIGAGRVVVRGGHDRAALTLVLEVLARVGGGR